MSNYFRHDHVVLGKGWGLRREPRFGFPMEKEEAEFSLEIKEGEISQESWRWLTLVMFSNSGVAPEITLTLNDVPCRNVACRSIFAQIYEATLLLGWLVPPKQLIVPRNEIRLRCENFKRNHLFFQSACFESQPVKQVSHVCFPIGCYGEEERKAVFIPEDERYLFQADLRDATHMSFGTAAFSSANSYRIELNVNDKRLWETDFPSNSASSWQDVRIDCSRWPRARLDIEFLIKKGAVSSTDGEGGVFVSEPLFFRHIPAIRRRAKKNVILVSWDTVRTDHLSTYGYGKKTTPCLDDISKKGVIFQHAFAPASWTIPSHISLFTGLHSSKLLSPNPVSLFSLCKEGLSSANTLAGALQANGYLTAAFTGSGAMDSALGFSNGFAQYANLAGWRRDKTEEIFKLGIDWIKKYRHSPFFLFLHTYEAHQPHLHRHFIKDQKSGGRIARQRWMEAPSVSFIPTPEEKNFAIDLYDSSIYHLDHYLGILMEELESLKISDDTILIVLSDHGEDIWDHFCWGHLTMHEEVLRVPVIFYNFPESKPAIINDEISLLDIFPTLAEGLQLRNVNPDSFDGVSLISCLKGKPVNRKIIFSECATVMDSSFHQVAIRNQNFKYIAESKISSPRSVINEQLYSLEEDPGEKRNLVQSCPESLLSFFRNTSLHFLLSLKRQQPTFSHPDQPYSPADELRIIQRLKTMGYL